MKFMDGGDYMRCNLCTLITKVPYLFQKPEQNEQRADLTMGSYDIKAGQEY
jgi:protein transport protein SEC24